VTVTINKKIKIKSFIVISKTVWKNERIATLESQVIKTLYHKYTSFLPQKQIEKEEQNNFHQFFSKRITNKMLSQKWEVFIFFLLAQMYNLPQVVLFFGKKKKVQPIEKPDQIAIKVDFKLFFISKKTQKKTVFATFFQHTHSIIFPSNKLNLKFQLSYLGSQLWVQRGKYLIIWI